MMDGIPGDSACLGIVLDSLCDAAASHFMHATIGRRRRRPQVYIRHFCWACEQPYVN